MSKGADKAKESSRNIGRWTVVLLSLGGLAAAWYLVEMHIQAVLGQDVGGSLCRAHDLLDCQAAAQSAFSTVAGIPIALFGLCFYAGTLLLALFDRESLRQMDKPFGPAALSASLYGLALLYSLFLGGVSLVVLKSACPFCVMLYLINGLGLGAALSWVGRSPRELMRAQLKSLREVINGWSGLFLLTFGFVLLVGVQIVEVALRDGAIEQAQKLEAKEAKTYDPGDYRLSDAPAKGPKDAPVHIVVFSTFPCPYCATFSPVLEVLGREFVEELRVEYRHFPMPTQEYGQETAYGAHCAGEQGAFWPMHDLLFERAPAHSPEEILGYVRELELDEEAFKRCESSSATKARVELDVEAGTKLGVDGTPTFFMNGNKFEGALPFDVLRSLIKEELRAQESDRRREY